MKNSPIVLWMKSEFIVWYKVKESKLLSKKLINSMNEQRRDSDDERLKHLRFTILPHGSINRSRLKWTRNYRIMV